MKLTASTQIMEDEFVLYDFDAIYYSSGYEKRSTYICEYFKIKSVSKNVLVFLNEERLNAVSNLKYYKSDCDNKIIISEGEEENGIINSLNLLFENTDKDELNILIDYSSMTSVWFSSFLNYFRYSFKNGKVKTVNLSYCYAHSEYTAPIIENDVKLSVDPLNGFSNISIPDKPTALIIGLGYEKNKATGLAQYLDAESYVFYTDSSYAEKFSAAVKKENCVLLTEVKRENIFEYPILNLNITIKILHTLILDLIQSNRIVLAPCGPKTFSLLCLIESIKVENTDVWRISSSKASKTVIDKVPDGKISIYRVTFENDIEQN